jgi:hypothetical protein
MQEINNKNQILIIWHSSLDLKIVTGPSKRTKIVEAPNFPKETLLIFSVIMYCTIQFIMLPTLRKPGVSY